MTRHDTSVTERSVNQSVAGCIRRHGCHAGWFAECECAALRERCAPSGDGPLAMLPAAVLRDLADFIAPTPPSACQVLNQASGALAALAILLTHRDGIEMLVRHRECEPEAAGGAGDNETIGRPADPETPNSQMPGHSALSGWFGLSRASFLTLPRVLMEAMPDAWQGQMAELLRQMDRAFPNVAEASGVDGYRVQCTNQRGQLIGTPDCVREYRRPERWFIEASRTAGGE